jgi:hypothetical protein
MSFGSENVQSRPLMIEVDPAGNYIYPVLKATRAIRVKGAYIHSENTISGTGITLTLLNYGTAGTAVQTGGTVTNGLGSGIVADVPAAFTLVDAATDIAEGEWLVWSLVEGAAGWQSGDRVFLQVDYTIGQ